MHTPEPPALALVLAAGRGARLRPLTDRLPKPLVPVLGRPVIEPILEDLAAAGLTRVGINTHWLPDALHARLGDGRAFGLDLLWRHEPQLLEGAGTLRSFAPEFGDSTAIVLNGDTVLEFDLPAALATHRRMGAVLTLVAAPPLGPPQRPVAWDDESWLRGIRRCGLDDPRGRWRGEFSGLHLVEPLVWRDFVPPGQPCNLVADVIPRLRAAGLPVACHLSHGLYADIGDPASLVRANLLALEHRAPRFLAAATEIAAGVWSEPGARLDGRAIAPAYLGRDSVVEADAVLGPYGVLGARARLGRGATLAYGVL
jgi:NDP-sugar pyrophosphorylase family protein